MPLARLAQALGLIEPSGGPLPVDARAVPRHGVELAAVRGAAALHQRGEAGLGAGRGRPRPVRGPGARVPARHPAADPARPGDGGHPDLHPGHGRLRHPRPARRRPAVDARQPHPAPVRRQPRLPLRRGGQPRADAASRSWGCWCCAGRATSGCCREAAPAPRLHRARPSPRSRCCTCRCSPWRRCR